MRLGTGLLYESRTLQGAHPKMADFCSAPLADFYAAVDNQPVCELKGHYLEEIVQERKDSKPPVRRYIEA